MSCVCANPAVEIVAVSARILYSVSEGLSQPTGFLTKVTVRIQPVALLASRTDLGDIRTDFAVLVQAGLTNVIWKSAP